MTQGLRVRTILHNTYRIEKVLGQGGFGITYLAIDVNLQRKVAIKEFFPKDYCNREQDTSQVTVGTLSTAEFVNRLKGKFIKEARNIAKFDNPNIIKILSAFEANNTAYYVMDFIEGESLAEKVKRNGPLAVDKALYYIKAIGQALEYVHSQRMTHLDVKPANIMVRQKDDKPLLIDFGLSKQYDTEGHQTSTTPVGISHGFAPMEQYNDGGVDEFSPQTDLYSLAATLYYLLTGVIPPQATRLIDEELTFPTSIPEYMIPAISKAMSSGRRNRHETVGEFLAELSCAEDKKDNIQSQPKKKVTIEKKKPAKTHKEPINVNQDTVIGNPQKNVKNTAKSTYRNIAVIGGICVAAIIGIILLRPKGASVEPAPYDSETIPVFETEVHETRIADTKVEAPKDTTPAKKVEKKAVVTEEKVVKKKAAEKTTKNASAPKNTKYPSPSPDPSSRLNLSTTKDGNANQSNRKFKAEGN